MPPLVYRQSAYIRDVIWAGPSEKGAYGFSDVVWANQVVDVIYDLAVGIIKPK